MPSQRNKTLSILPEEEASLSQMVSTPTTPFDSGICCADLMSCIDLLPDSHFPLIIADPPYNIFRNFHGNSFHPMDNDEYEAYLRQWLPKLATKLTPDGSLYLCGDWKCTAAMQKVLSESLTVINRITWQREKGRGARANWKNAMEDIWFAVRDPKNYHFDLNAVKQRRRVRAPYRENGKPKDWEETGGRRFRDTCPSNFWDDISIPFWSMPENTPHPTQKPEKLIAKLILASSRPGDTVLDPFLGSGTTAAVATKLGRGFCGIEINPEYCLWAAKRVMMAEKDRYIQGYQGNVFWERNTFLDINRKDLIIESDTEQA